MGLDLACLRLGREGYSAVQSSFSRIPLRCSPQILRFADRRPELFGEPSLAQYGVVHVRVGGTCMSDTGKYAIIVWTNCACASQCNSGGTESFAPIDLRNWQYRRTRMKRCMIMTDSKELGEESSPPSAPAGCMNASYSP